MAEGQASKGEVKHILLAKFKDGIPQEEIDQLIKGYANLVNHIQPMKSFCWYFTILLLIHKKKASTLFLHRRKEEEGVKICFPPPPLSFCSICEL